jgi:alanyl-tRNA synthetase
MNITHVQLRKLFADFWESKNHKLIPPISLIPENDPTTLFTSAGMQPLIPYLMGKPHPVGKRLYNIQPCFRTQDIEEVGDNRHMTFFEMMGNWSLGNYFKEDQLAWVWEFFTKSLGLPKEKLFVSVFAGTKDVPRDEESAQIWKKLGISEQKIFYYGLKYNWWSRSGMPEQMPVGEIGGPDSEIFYDFGADKKCGPDCQPWCNCGRFLEIGNSVFIQYKKNEKGMLEELPIKSVDFGGGLERILAAVNNDDDIFTIDVFSSIISTLEKTIKVSYQDNKNQSAFRVVSDHVKASVFLIANGVTLSNKEQGYFLRRLLRRSAVKMRLFTDLSQTISVFKTITASILETYDGIYFNKTKDLQKISAVIENELNRFSKTIDMGLKEIQKLETIDGKKAFDIYQTYGFPLEIMEELMKEKGQQIDKKIFREEFEKHRQLSRTASAGMFKSGLADNSGQVVKYHTATHLIHQALFDVLKTDVRQEGSNITGERLRFDFSAPAKPTEEQIKEVEKIVNQKIQEGLPVYFKEMSKKKAMQMAAKAFFKQKYPDIVKVYFINNYSKELCGGPHVDNTKELGSITIYKTEKIGANTFRVYAKKELTNL